MTQEQHPITPPQSLISERERNLSFGCDEDAIFFARWGADQELEACCEWLNFYAADVDARDLRNARRPKPQSIKQQALRILAENGKTLDGRIELEPEDIPIILSAIQSIPEK